MADGAIATTFRIFFILAQCSRQRPASRGNFCFLLLIDRHEKHDGNVQGLTAVPLGNYDILQPTSRGRYLTIKHAFKMFVLEGQFAWRVRGVSQA